MIVNQLIGLGIAPLATELARRSLPLAGRLQHFKKQLGEDHPGSMGVRNHTRLQNTFQSAALPPIPTKSLNSLSSRGSSHAAEDSEYAREACNRRNHTQGAWFPVNHLLGSQERWRPEACNQPEELKQVCLHRALQNGRYMYTHPERPAKSRRLDEKVDLKDAYFMVPIYEEDRPFLKFSSNSSMEEPAVVSHPTGDAGRLPNPPPIHGGSNHTNTPRGCTSSTASTSRMAYLRQRFRDKEILEEGTELLLASWRQKSSKSYDSLFRKWVDWCNQRHSDPISGPIIEVINFLAHMFKEGYQYHSLNAYRSAISSVHEKADGYKVGQHPLVSRLLKGVFNQRPPKPHYMGCHQSTKLH